MPRILRLGPHFVVAALIFSAGACTDSTKQVADVVLEVDVQKVEVQRENLDGQLRTAVTIWYRVANKGTVPFSTQWNLGQSGLGAETAPERYVILVNGALELGGQTQGEQMFRAETRLHNAWEGAQGTLGPDTVTPWHSITVTSDSSTINGMAENVPVTVDHTLKLDAHVVYDDSNRCYALASRSQTYSVPESLPDSLVNVAQFEIATITSSVPLNTYGYDRELSWPYPCIKHLPRPYVP